VLFGGERRVVLASRTMDIRGHLDRCDAGGVGGWVYDPEAPEGALLQVLVDGELAVETRADGPRPEMLRTLGRSHLGFGVPMGAELGDGDAHEVTVRLARTGEVLFDGPRIVLDGAAGTAADADGSTRATPRARPTYPLILPEDTRFFFLVGSMKSGTTWLMNVLGAHPDICSRGEMHPLEHIAAAPSLQSLARNAETLKRWYLMPNSSWNVPFRGERRRAAALRRLETDYVRFFYEWTVLRYLEATGAGFPSVIGDKSPSHTRAIVGTLERHFGVYRPHVIHIMRDPRDVAVSSWFHLRRMQNAGNSAFGAPFRDAADREACERLLADPDGELPPDEPFFRYPGHLEGVFDEWLQVNETLSRDGPEVFGDRYVFLRYEDLKTDFDGIVGALLDRLSVDASPTRLAEIRERTDVTRQKVKPSVFRKGAVGDHARYFRDRDHELFRTRIRAFSQRFGYV
jgi:hypothetical protein